jgi:hypothetical protein
MSILTILQKTEKIRRLESGKSHGVVMDSHNTELSTLYEKIFRTNYDPFMASYKV